MQNYTTFYPAEETQQTEPFEKGGIPMEQRNYMMPSIIFTAGLIILGIMAYISADKYIQSQAVADCLDAARVEAVNGGSERVGAPESYWFNVCLDKSGYSNE